MKPMFASPRGSMTPDALRVQNTLGLSITGLHYQGDGTRVVTDPRDEERIYSTAVVGGQRRYTSSDMPCGGCSESAGATYDAHGNFATRTDFNGNQTKTIYDLTRTSRSIGPMPMARLRSARLPRWHPTFRRPVS